MKNKLKLSRSIVSYDALSDIDETFNLGDETLLFSLKEDILQIECEPLGLLVDVGWYPEFNPRGRFRIYVIQHADWDQPLEEKTAKNLAQLFDALTAIIERHAL
ncbi:hypothetical protein [Chromobacterium haemolyticum]|uniref:hypothetical protein n=1 Tax=Chromobacterium TaxID=535 RepID=UPI0040574851